MLIRARIEYLPIRPEEISYSLSSLTESRNMNFKPQYFILHHKSIDMASGIEVGTRARAGMSPVIGSAGTVAVAVGEGDLELVV